MTMMMRTILFSSALIFLGGAAHAKEVKREECIKHLPNLNYVVNTCERELWYCICSPGSSNSDINCKRDAAKKRSGIMCYYLEPQSKHGKMPELPVGMPKAFCDKGRATDNPHTYSGGKIVCGD